MKIPTCVKTMKFGAALQIFGASAAGPPEAQAPQPKAAALVFFMYSLENKLFENMCELLNNAPNHGPAATGVTKNLYIIVMFHTF